MDKDNLIEFAKEQCEIFPEDSAMGWYLRKTLKMLQAEPCEDAVSREDMQEIVDKKVEEMTIRKKGHWIMTNDYFTGAYGNIDYVECSVCGEESLEEGDFLPKLWKFYERGGRCR